MKLISITPKKCIAFIVILFHAVVSNAQKPAYLGTKTPYVAQQSVYAKAPVGYNAVFINYVGRHGSRFLTSPGSDVLLMDVLQQAKDQHSLTSNGEKIYALIKIFDSIQKNNYGNITLLGGSEQHDIASRMQQEYTAAFKQRKILIEMTEKLRTQQSAQAFLSGLNGYDTAAIEQIIFPSKTDSLLRFYDLSPAYDSYVESHSMKGHIDSLQHDIKTKNIADAICSKIFSNAFIDQLNSEKITSIVEKKTQSVDPVIFAQALYDVYSVLFSAIEEMKIDDAKIKNTFKGVFTKDKLKWLDELNSAEDFYEKGPADDTLGIQVTIAASLLRNLVLTTDSCLATKNIDGIFRFTHAEAISPLATLMGIPQASQQTNSVYSFYKNWQASHIIPLSANIQWIIYSNGSNYLIKILLNEKEVKLPVATVAYPYYNWEDVKHYYLDKLIAIK